MSVVAFRSTSRALNIYKLNDLMTRKGWHLNALQVGAHLLAQLRTHCCVLQLELPPAQKPTPPALQLTATSAHLLTGDVHLSGMLAPVPQLSL